MKRENSISFNKKVVRDTYAQHAKQIVDDQNGLKLQKILNINFGEDAMIVIAKQKLVIYSTINMKVFYVRKGYFWDAFFIPNTALVAVIQHDGTLKSKRTVRCLDLEKDSFVGSITQIKCSKNCMLLIGLSQISVVHVPTFKPICHQLAGSGMKVICDISFEGLTLAYDGQRKGRVTLHNFSSVFTMQARRRSSNENKQLATSSLAPRLEGVKKLIQISAHSQYISNIKLSPNGSRLATTSNKGTVIRIFLTESGKLWEELRVGYQLIKILDLSFYEEGNVLSCLTEKGMVYLFNAKLQPNQEQAQNQKRGYKIYQQKNPKSFFSFLSFFNSNLNNQHPFASFKLIKPQQKNKESVEQAYSPLVAPAVKQEQQKFEQQKKQQIMEIVKEQTQNQMVQVEEEQMKELKNQKNQRAPEPKLNKSNSQMPAHLLQSEKNSRSYSLALSDRSSKKSKSLLTKLNIMQSKKDNYDYVEKIYNTVSKIFVGGNNFVWAVKGPYIFTLKYDPFNGGQMYHSETHKFC